MRRGLAAVLLCVLVFAAGCSAIPIGGNGGETSPGGDGSGGSDGTAESVPGVENGSLVNGTALLDTHVRTITETGYAHYIAINGTTVRNGNITDVTQQKRTEVSAGAEEYLTQLIRSGESSERYIVWGNRSVAVRSAEVGGSVPQYQSIPPRSPENLAGRALLDGRLSSEFEVVDVDERADAPNLVTMEVDALPEDNDAFSEQEVSNIREYEARLVVDTEGRIHGYTETAALETEGERTDYEFRLEMNSFEDPGVERPSWATPE
jgi:hypothetical protein